MKIINMYPIIGKIADMIITKASTTTIRLQRAQMMMAA